jgi:hypothetical protein
MFWALSLLLGRRHCTGRRSLIFGIFYAAGTVYAITKRIVGLFLIVRGPFGKRNGVSFAVCFQAGRCFARRMRLLGGMVTCHCVTHDP